MTHGDKFILSDFAPRDGLPFLKATITQNDKTSSGVTVAKGDSEYYGILIW